MKKYKVNEIFYSLQGEGGRAGLPHVFVRFSDCNLACKKDGPMGFDCDTEFVSGTEMSAEEIVCEAERLAGSCRHVIFTGGEPMLQVDQHLCEQFSSWYKCVETNGTIEIPQSFDLQWICVSPKTAEHTLKVHNANEVKYVRRRGQEIPQPRIKADLYLVSPAFDDGIYLSKPNLDWCVELVKKNATWRLSIQQHKLWGVR